MDLAPRSSSKHDISGTEDAGGSRSERAPPDDGSAVRPLVDSIAGQGTAGLEILDQCPTTVAVLVPIGGGGLAAGVSAAIKLSRPSIKVIGVEPSGAAAMKASMDAGRAVTLDRTHSIADGLMPVRPGDLTFAHVRRFLDQIVMVDDVQIARAVLWLSDVAGVAAEPSGAATVAAALEGAISIDGPVVAIVSGGNMDPGTLDDLRQLVNHSSPLA